MKRVALARIVTGMAMALLAWLVMCYTFAIRAHFDAYLPAVVVAIHVIAAYGLYRRKNFARKAVGSFFLVSAGLIFLARPRLLAGLGHSLDAYSTALILYFSVTGYLLMFSRSVRMHFGQNQTKKNCPRM
jgi:hypothetical protein